MVVELGRGSPLGTDGTAVRMRPIRLDLQDAPVGIRARHHRAVHRAEPAVALDHTSHRGHPHEYSGGSLPSSSSNSNALHPRSPTACAPPRAVHAHLRTLDSR